MRAQRQLQATSINRPTFTNEFDHSSEPSREGSVQIVESHRHTFSVPSSDDDLDSEDEEDEVHISSSIHGDEEISAATTPDRQAVGKAHNKTEDHVKGSRTDVASVVTRGSNLKGPGLRDLLIETDEDGTSQENPINLEGVCTKIIDVDTESEDDGPEVLPIYESSKTDQSKPLRVLDERSPVCQTSTVVAPEMMTMAEKKADQDSELLHPHSFVPETQAKEPNVRGHQTTSAHVYPNYLASEDDDPFDYDHEVLTEEELEQLPDSPAIEVNNPTHSKPKVTFQVGNEKPHYTTLTPPFDEFHPTRLSNLSNLSASDAIDVSQPAGPSSAWTQRAPSPSDAALARKASDSKTESSRDLLDRLLEPRWPAFPMAVHNDSAEQTFDSAPLRLEATAPYVWPELQTPEPRSYDQGPFSSQSKAAVPGLDSLKLEIRKNQTKKTSVTWADPQGDNYDFIMNADSFARTGKRASKITIPSLVENYLAENPRAVKRKYGGMKRSNDVESASKPPRASSPTARTSGYKRTFEQANAVPSSHTIEDDLLCTKIRPHGDLTNSQWQADGDIATQRQFEDYDQDTPLPDAQPREVILHTPTASPTQDSIARPALESVTVTARVQDDDAEGPARKRARTSLSTSSRGIGKFVLGVGFGLLGAAAVFVATIPASVYEEALREFGNAA